MKAAPDGAIMLNLDTIGKPMDMLDADFSTGVMLAILAKCNKDNHARITIDRISKHIGISRCVTERAIECLENAGIVKQIADGDFMVNPDIAFAGEWTLQKKLEYKAMA